MELKKLRIQNFKSIKTVQNIDLSQPLITLIGKNGSGKTNVLDGIFTVFDSRSTKEREGMDYRFFIEINDKELNEYNDILNIDNNSPIIEAYSTKEKDYLDININRIKSTFLNDILNKTEKSIYSISELLMGELESFNKIIKDLAEDKPDFKKFAIDVEFTDEDIANSTNYGWLFSSLNNEIKDLVKK